MATVVSESDVIKMISSWEFLLTVAPLRLQHTTGSPVNPIALF